VQLPDLHVLFWIVAVLMVIGEVALGVGTGVPLAGAVTFFLLGLLEWLGVLQGLNSRLFVGAVLFAVSTFLILRYFKGRASAISREQDVNDY
jgi:hypothetical protein